MFCLSGRGNDVNPCGICLWCKGTTFDKRLKTPVFPGARNFMRRDYRRTSDEEFRRAAEHVEKNLLSSSLSSGSSEEDEEDVVVAEYPEISSLGIIIFLLYSLLGYFHLHH